jgi:hypothetical protein
MSEEHKAQLNTGREQSRIVREYLTAIESNRPRRGRKRTVESTEKRIRSLDERLAAETDPLKRLQYLAERTQLEGVLEGLSDSPDLVQLEKAFIAVVGDYSVRKNITFEVWKQVGVPVNVLREGNVPRSL